MFGLWSTEGGNTLQTRNQLEPVKNFTPLGPPTQNARFFHSHYVDNKGVVKSIRIAYCKMECMSGLVAVIWLHVPPVMLDGIALNVVFRFLYLGHIVT